jgi:hypothetical protein
LKASLIKQYFLKPFINRYWNIAIGYMGFKKLKDSFLGFNEV